MSKLNSILYNNRNQKEILGYLSKEDLLYNYLGCSVEQLRVMYEMVSTVVKLPLLQESRKLTMDKKLLSPYKKSDEPRPSLQYCIDKSKEGLFDRCNKYLIDNDKEAMEFLKHRGVTLEQIKFMKLGSTKYLTFEERVQLGASVHPAMWRRYKKKEVDGIICPIDYKDNTYIGTFIRILSVADMKYSSSCPNLFIHGLHTPSVWSSNEVYLVEGYYDKLALHSIGIDNVITTSNAFPDVTQITSIMTKCARENKTLILASDSDRAGLNEQIALSIIAKLIGIPTKHLLFEPSEHAKDLAEYLVRDGHTASDINNHLITDSKHVRKVYSGLKAKAESEGDLTYDEYLKRRRTVSVDWF